MSFLGDWYRRIEKMREVAKAKETIVVFAMRYGRAVTLGMIFPPETWRRYDNDNHRRQS